jgi:hypothetical protein
MAKLARLEEETPSSGSTAVAESENLLNEVCNLHMSLRTINIARQVFSFYYFDTLITCAK